MRNQPVNADNDPSAAAEGSAAGPPVRDRGVADALGGERGLVGLRAVVADQIVGRRHELDLILSAIAAGRDLLLEGPPGTSKSTILRAITTTSDLTLHLVEGNADLTPAKLIGHHNPARVLKEDYSPDNFVAGPLIAAMQTGGFLYIEEFNRAPDDTLNTLLGAMAERQVTIPRVGTITAAPTFRLVASMNPYDNIGTTRIPASVYDRLCRLAINYQTATDEHAIVTTRTGTTDTTLASNAVALTRATRTHPEIRSGASVRGAIDLTLIAIQLAHLRHPNTTPDHTTFTDAALLALTGRIDIYETSPHTPEQLITQLAEDLLLLGPARATGDLHLDVVPAVELHRDSSAAGRRPLSRKPKQLTDEPNLFQPGGHGSVIVGIDSRARHGQQPAGPQDGVAVVESTEELGATIALQDLLEDVEIDPDVQAMAERIARRLAVRNRSGERARVRGRGRLVTVPFRYGSDDIDLDKTIEMLAERPLPEETDILVRERMHASRAVVLIGDVSGSMDGEKVRIATATIAALSAELADDELAVVAFWKDAALLQPIDRPRPRADLLRDLLRIPARGLTNITFGLQTAAVELTRARSTRRIGIILSDMVHNAGPDPRDIAGHFETLHVLLEMDGEHDAALAGELAAIGGGQLVGITNHTQIPEALNRLLAS